MALLTPKEAQLLRKQREQALLEQVNQADERRLNQLTEEANTNLTLDDALEPFTDYYHTSSNILDLLFNQKRCPRCNAPLVPTPSISGAPSTDWLECSNNVCNTFVDTYHPMAHQASVHLDSHRIIGNFGSYGTGKTKKVL